MPGDGNSQKTIDASVFALENILTELSALIIEQEK